jgi:ABC-type antimicrobial peptide transport system permease subunit
VARVGDATLLTGAVGVYGVIAHAVSQRRCELGIRAALGAPRRDLSGMFVRQSLRLSGIGVLIGLLAAAVLMRLMSTLLYGITSLDPVPTLPFLSY